MKILHVITSLAMGGAETLLKDLAIYFKKNNLDITIIIFTRNDNYIEELLLNNGIKIIHCPENKRFSFRNLFFIYRHLRENKYDIIHTHLTWDQYALALINFLFGGKLFLVTTVHSTEIRRRNMFFIKIFSLEKWLYKQYSKIICVSAAVFDSLVTYLNMVERKCVIIENGINLQVFSADYNSYLKISNPIILCVGTLSKRKDQFTLVRSMKFVKDSAKLWLVGQGEEHAALKNMIKDLGLEEKVLLLGKRNDISELIKNSTIYVQPSLYEGFGIAILEAMAGGLPIIASDVSGLKKLVYGVGLFFPVGDFCSLAEMINSLLSKPKLLDDLSAKSKQHSLNFSIDKTAEKYCSLYKQLIAH